MNATLASNRARSNRAGSGTFFSRVKHYLRLTFVCGPKVLFTSRISGKCAFIMMLMTAPSLLFCALLIIPGLIFQSPHQQAYFYFSSMLDKDPARWVVLCLAGFCTLMSLAIPATMRASSTPIRY